MIKYHEIIDKIRNEEREALNEAVTFDIFGEFNVPVAN